MNPTRIALAAVALLAAATAPTPAAAGAAPAAWLPAPVAMPLTFDRGTAAFPNGVGYLAGVTTPGNVGGVVDVADQSTSLFRTADHGRTWAPLTATGLPNPEAVTFVSPVEGWAYAANGLSRSTDAGATWTPAATLPLAPGETLSLPLGDGFSISRDGAAMALAGSVRQAGAPCNGDDGDAILWSTDDGATWAETRFPTAASGNGVLVNSVEAVDAGSGVALATEIVPAGCDWVAEGNDVYVTDDTGATWTQVVDDAAGGRWVGAATMTGSGALVVGWSDGAVDVSTDGGATFTTTAVLDSGTEVEVYPAFHFEGLHRITDLAFDGSTGYAAQDGGRVWRTTDGGLTWAADGIAGSLGLSQGTRLAVFDADHAFAVTPGAGAVTYRVG